MRVIDFGLSVLPFAYRSASKPSFRLIHFCGHEGCPFSFVKELHRRYKEACVWDDYEFLHIHTTPHLKSCPKQTIWRFLQKA